MDDLFSSQRQITNRYLLEAIADEEMQDETVSKMRKIVEYVCKKVCEREKEKDAWLTGYDRAMKMNEGSDLKIIPTDTGIAGDEL